MSSSLSDILQTGRSAMAINQLAMQIIGHNTANVNTEGYSRRRIDLATAVPSVLGNRWHGGNGVDIESVGRIRDRMIEQQLRNAVTGEGYWEARDGLLGQVESVYDELSDTAISDKLNQFWSAWHDLANDPESDAARFALREKSLGLTTAVNRAHQALSEQQEQLDSTIGDRIGDINRITQDLASLNTDIVRTLNSGVEPSDLLDQRDLLIEQLATIIDVHTSEDASGAINVYSGGQILVQRDIAVPLTIQGASTTEGRTLQIGVGVHGRAFAPESGELKALIDVRDQDIARAIEDLNSFARELATAVNNAHRAGYGLNNSHGLDYFTYSNSAASLQLSTDIADDVSNIATGGSPDAPGDNAVALAIAGLQNQRLLNDGQSTLDEFYRQGALSLSSTREYARSEFDVQSGAAENLRVRRAEVSGVSMDEEMSRLIQVQNAYEAAAKIVRTVDEMMQTVITIGA